MVTEPRQRGRQRGGVGAVLAEVGDWKIENKCGWSLGAKIQGSSGGRCWDGGAGLQGAFCGCALVEFWCCGYSFYVLKLWH